MHNTKATEALNAFMERYGLTGSAVALALGVTKGIVSQWRAGNSRPGHEMRLAIQRWSRGTIRALDWLTDDEQTMIAAVIPFRRSAVRTAHKAAA